MVLYGWLAMKYEQELTHNFFLQDNSSFYLRKRMEPLYMEKCFAQVKPTYKVKLR